MNNVKHSSLDEIYQVYKSCPNVCTDTRNIVRESIFFALKGENFNANSFAKQALDLGASFAIIDEVEFYVGEKTLLVTNVLDTLQKLANYHRKRFNIPVIGITGSNGKTTTKELLYGVLSKKFNVLATEGNLNNHIGVPLTILKLNKNHNVAVIEMGANHQGEIAFLSEIAQPTIGIITNIGKAHLEGFGGIEGVIKGKSELYDFITKAKGLLFVNSDNEILKNKSKNCQKILYGFKEPTNCLGNLVSLNPFVRIQFKYHNYAESTPIDSNLIGIYNAENILCAICAGCYFEVDNKKIEEAIQTYIPSNSRSQIIKRGNNTIILDAYNANPTSTKFALETFNQYDKKNKIVILGDMLELGDESQKEHQQIIDYLTTISIDKVFLVGNSYLKTQKPIIYKSFNNSLEAKTYFKNNTFSESSILLKGSRGTKLELLLDCF